MDGASGGFLAPFCAPDLVWDFRLPRVKSINASGHKFGLSPLVVGWVIWRDAEDLPDDLADRLRVRGWQVPAYSLPAECQDAAIQRVLVRHGVSQDLGTLLVEDIKRALRFRGRGGEELLHVFLEQTDIPVRQLG